MQTEIAHHAREVIVKSHIDTIFSVSTAFSNDKLRERLEICKRKQIFYLSDKLPINLALFEPVQMGSSS